MGAAVWDLGETSPAPEAALQEVYGRQVRQVFASHSTDLRVRVTPKMGRHVFELGELAILLQKHSKVLADRVNRPVTVRRLTTVSDKSLVSKIALLHGPFVEKIEYVIQSSDLLHEIPALCVDGLVKLSEQHGNLLRLLDTD